MITYEKGDLSSADVEALVNTVNTVGVMGKGIACYRPLKRTQILKSLNLAGKTANLKNAYNETQLDKEGKISLKSFNELLDEV